MAIEVQRRLEHAVGSMLPSALIFNHPTIPALVDLLEGVMASRIQVHEDNDEVGELLARVDELSDEEVEKLLNKFEVDGSNA